MELEIWQRFSTRSISRGNNHKRVDPATIKLSTEPDSMDTFKSQEISNWWTRVSSGIKSSQITYCHGVLSLRIWWLSDLLSEMDWAFPRKTIQHWSFVDTILLGSKNFGCTDLISYHIRRERTPCPDQTYFEGTSHRLKKKIRTLLVVRVRNNLFSLSFV